MKRDNDLIRALLFKIEGLKEHQYMVPVHLHLTFEQKNELHHLKLIAEAGLLEESGSNGGVFRITNSGYDFIEAIRDDANWNKVKEGAAQLSGATLEILRDVGLAII